MIMNVSALCGSGFFDVRRKAEKLTDILYTELFAFAVKYNQITILNNALLVNLGLIKVSTLTVCFKLINLIVCL